MAAKPRPASPIKPQAPVQKSTTKAPPTMPATTAGGIDDEDLDMLDADATAHTQEIIDHALTREFEGVCRVIAGVKLRPLSMSAVMRLHQVNNEILLGKMVKDMDNSVYAAAEFLYSLALENPLEEVVAAAFGDPIAWRIKVSTWAETVVPDENTVNEVIDFVNDSSSTRVKARLPQALAGATSEGNE